MGSPSTDKPLYLEERERYCDNTRKDDEVKDQERNLLREFLICIVY